MSYLVFGLGLLLSIFGSAAAYFGYGIVTVERGWSSLIAGTTALSCGIVTIALAFILRSLAKLQAVLGAEKEAGLLPDETLLSRAATTPLAPHAQSFDYESNFPGEDSPEAPYAPPAKEAPIERLKPRQPTGEAADGDRARARAPAEGPQENSDAALVSIEDVRRLVAAKISAWPPRQTQSANVDRRKLESETDSAVTGKAPPARGPESQMAQARSPDLGSQPSPRPAGLSEAAGQRGTPNQADAARRAAPRPANVESNATLASFGSPKRAAENAAVRPQQQAPAKPDDGAAADPPLHQSRAPQVGAEAAPNDPDPANPSDPSAAVEELAVVGRYEADGTSYVMYADGSIDAQSDRGVFHFKSMADLKAFIESQG